MPFFLAQRDIKAKERMDDPECDRAELINTYRQFSTINSMISGWNNIYKKYIKPVCVKEKRAFTLLDIGFGGGDIPLKLAKWAARDGIQLEITAIETDPRALEFVQSLEVPQNVHFEKSSSSEILRRRQTFDFVISNHLLHHLNEKAFHQLLSEARQLSTHHVLFNDIERSDWGYLMFNLLARPVFRSSFITHDGLTSIKRSYTYKELQKKIPKGWKVQRLFPLRLLLRYEHEEL